MTTKLLLSFVRGVLLTSAVPLAVSCTTTHPGRKRPSDDPNALSTTRVGTAQEKPGTNTAPAETSVALNSGETLSEAIRTPSERAQLAFIRTHASPSSNFDATAHNFVSSLPSSPEPGTVTEAALALGLVKTILHPLNAIAPSFQESDIGHSSDASAPRTIRNSHLSLASLCEERGIHLADAVVENPLLHSYPIAKQIADALERSPTSPEFKSEILLALRTQAAQWSGLGQELDGSPQESEALPQPTLPDGTDRMPLPDELAPPNPADLKGGDAILGESQALADRGQYQAAIQHAQGVTPDSPMHAMAQEKIKEYSNRAVQDLRRQAAAAFQSAMPIADRRVRAQYLEQAKAYLEEALQKYPDATQLPTVRDNLNVISRDLDRLQSEQGG